MSRYRTLKPLRSYGRMLLPIVLILAAGAGSHAQTAPSTGRLVVNGDVEKPLSLSMADLAQLPHKTITASNEHQSAKETYEGVPLTELLARAGVPQGAKLRGPAMATYVLAEGSDGYRVVFSLAELDTDFQDSQVIVADKMNGQPLGDKIGPLRLVAPNDKRPARWVRMLQSIKIVTVPK